ncbi:hypothetical protein Pedsa_3059 [Pseudopedobacter saltans DSM 12145]|uniref:DUF4843 domain-containing protein n=1 Tax=Pseudopedobacter saltans (strain ATCC 51119 / DSM 12145 / JCM 21818 / CCUG 39354 / LMG 10337 / NBRC 100064 / NCIMB 13643) TaxID=762903 RepID=F0SA34_PSESL|nr:hypothetical protein [Pseudopedobacter saltans]ADY53598.1 hypothetical protein Pedsa_3059 [Pseudopedobacter saltans DSM 12145]
MKSKILIGLTLVISSLIFSCKEDRDYLLGLPELDHHYYIAYVPYNNAQITVNRNQSSLLKLPVSFNSSFTRGYDAVAHYRITKGTAANTTSATLGVDFQIVNKEGAAIQPSADGKYAIVFPQAKKARDTIYVKLLNNPAPGDKSINIDLIRNTTNEFIVDTMSVAYRRPILIK